jgi:nucleoside-diphosphate-sugar epimerase
MKTSFVKTIFVTGCDGYIGWPTVLKLLEQFPDTTIVGCDNGARREWVQEVGGDSFIPISTIKSRIKKINSLYSDRFIFYQRDLTSYFNVRTIIEDHQPDVVLHLAAQPSAPYSNMSPIHCSYTQKNNTEMLLNILWALHENHLNNTNLVVTTTTGIYGAPDYNIPEGNLVFNQMEVPHPSMGGSWYHMSRSFDSSNLWLASKQFKFPINEMRTGIVTGSSTKETRKMKTLSTRFDIDPYFGVVTNRFVVQALKKEPLTIYGKGQQMKPMISLEDMTRSMVEICKIIPIKHYEIYNQFEKTISIVDLATAIKDSFKKSFDFDVEINHVLNPRIENEEHKMIMDNAKFLSLIGGIQQTIEKSVAQICKDVMRRQIA